MPRAGGATAYGKDAVNVGIAQAFAQRALADHTGGAEDHNIHDAYLMQEAAIPVPNALFRKRNLCGPSDDVIEAGRERLDRMNEGRGEQNRSTSERQRLKKLYTGMSDGELESLGRDQEELTEWAREALRSEMLERGLEWPEDPVENGAELPNDGKLLLVLRSYADMAKAAEDRAALKRVGIEAHFFGETAPGLPGLVTWVPSDGVRLLVRAAELAK